MVTVGIFPFKENSYGRAGNRTRNLMISSQRLWPLDHEAGLYVSMYVCVYVSMYYVCLYVRMYVCTYVCIYVCVYVSTYYVLCMYVCILSMYVCM